MRGRLCRTRRRWVWRCWVVVLCASLVLLATGFFNVLRAQRGPLGIGLHRMQLVVIWSHVAVQFEKGLSFSVTSPGGIWMKDPVPVLPGIVYNEMVAMRAPAGPGTVRIVQVNVWWMVGLLVGVTALLCWLSWRRVPPGCCVWCDYDLAGAPLNICPECGRAQEESGTDGARVVGAAGQ